MPTCQQIMSVTVSGPFTIGPTSSPSATSSHQRGSAPRGASAAYWASMRGDLVVGVGGRARRRRTSCAPGPSCARCGSSAGTAPTAAGRRRRGTPGRSTRARPARRTRSACRARPTSALRRATRRARPQRRPPLAGAGRVEGVDAAQRIALHERLLVVGASSVTSSSPISVSPPTSGGGAIGPAPPGRRRRRRVAPQRVVVAVGLGDVAEGVGVGARGSAAAAGGARRRRSGPAGGRSPSSVIRPASRRDGVSGHGGLPTARRTPSATIVLEVVEGQALLGTWTSPTTTRVDGEVGDARGPLRSLAERRTDRPDRSAAVGLAGGDRPRPCDRHGLSRNAGARRRRRRRGRAGVDPVVGRAQVEAAEVRVVAEEADLEGDERRSWASGACVGCRPRSHARRGRPRLGGRNTCRKRSSLFSKNEYTEPTENSASSATSFSVVSW